MAWLYAHMGNHITVDAREGSAFNRNATIVADSVRAKEKEPSLLDDDLAVGAARLALYSVPAPELAAFVKGEAGGPVARSELRAAAAAWSCTNKKAVEAATAQRIAECFAEVVPHFPTIAVIVGGDSGGSALGAGKAAAYSEVESLAVRLKLIPAGDPMGLPAKRELESSIAHLCGMLKTDTWRGRTVSERAAHVMTTVRDAERLH
jgi:hypothetical protein